MLQKLAPIEEVLKDAAAGRMFILVDDEDRENEGDLVIPAQFADADKINFMAKHGRGLICLAMTSERIKQLNLPLMSQANASRHQTAFTISIEAREGIATGISAHDRALTVKTAIDPEKGSHDIISPGHIFPLVAKDGGVLVRSGHTEAAVDIARMAGLNPSGVICEVMSEDGTMARLMELRKFAALHKINIATIADLISYRRKNEKLIKKIADTQITSHYGGEFRMMVYANTIEYAEHIALVKGKIDPKKPTLVRMHSHNILDDSLGDLGSPKSGLLQKSMQMIDEAGSGVIIIIRSPDKQALSQRLDESTHANPQLREYGIGAQILLDLGVHDMILLTNSTKSLVGLEGYNLHISGTQEIK